MTENGLVPVQDPSSLFLTKRKSEQPAGVACTPVFEGSRVFLVEIQALTVPAKASISRIYSEKIDNGRIARISAVIEKRCGYEKDGSFSTSKEDRWEMFDAGIATQTFCLAAHEKGVGSVIMGIFDEDKVAELISLEEGRKVAALIAVGYPDEEPALPKRKEVEELVRFL